MNRSTLQSRLRRCTFLSHALVAVLAAQMALPPQLRAAGVSTAVTVSSTFDGNGNVTSRTDGNGVATSYTYDAMNRISGIDYPGGSSADVSFTFDANGNRTSMTDGTGVTTFAYDFYDRLVRVDYPDSGFVTYSYDLVGNVTELLYGNMKAVNAGKGYTDIQYTYDADNRIASVKNVFANTTTSYTYNDAGHPLKRTLPNGVTTDYGYDSDGRLVSVDHKKADATRICKYAYTLNAIGNRTQVVETLPDGSTKTTSYSYDALDRLTTATYPDGRAVSYLYDSYGNRTKMTEVTGTTKVTDYTYDNDSRLLSTKVNNVADEVFSYDTTGNLIQRVRASDNRQIDYAYDAENRLVRYFDGTNNVQYIYNGSGYRVTKIVNGVRINYVNDLNRTYVQVLTETDTSGNAQRVYEWGNELIDQVAGATRGYHLHDAINGSIRRVVDAAGVIANSYEYDAFGRAVSKSEIYANDYQFGGECQEEETGGTFLRSRILESETGRFLTRDEYSGRQSTPSTLNKYTFVDNDPINKRDPAGLATEPSDSFATRWVETAHRDYETVKGVTNEVLDVLDAHKTAVGALFTGSVIGKSILQNGQWITRIPGAIVNDSVASALGRATSTPQYWLPRAVQASASLDGLFLGHIGAVAINGAARAGAVAAATVAVPLIVSTTVQAAAQPYYDTPFFQGIGDSLFAAKSAINNFSFRKIGGVALNRSASVLLDINNITGGTYDATTGQIILFGKQDTSPTALPKMSLDDLAVAVKAKQLGTFPVVSIEDPIVTNQPEWPGRECATVRYGPFYTDSLDGQRKVLDVSSKTHFGWVMFEADRLMKSLGLGKDNRTLQPVSSNVAGYKSWMNLAFQYQKQGSVKSRFWFNPKEIVVQPSPDGKSMQITKADMQVSTETMFASNGQVESTPDAEYYATWFTNNYDAIAEEQTTYDDSNQPHKVLKELKQLAYLAGVVKWIADNNVPVDLGFLKDYQPTYFPSAPSITPQTSFSEQRVSNGGNGTIKIQTVTITGGVNFCNDLVLGTGGNPTGLGAAAASARPAETSLGWSFSNSGQNYNATAISVDRTEKPGSMSPTAMDAQFKVKGSMPLVLGRYFDSFNNTPTLFGWGWKAQPYALEFKGNRETFSLCHQTWSGYGEVWFTDRASARAYKFVPSGTYDKVADPQGLASRFDPTKDILVYRYESKAVPGLLFSDNYTHMTMKLDSGELLDFNFDGVLTRTEDRNGNRIDYSYDANKRLTSISQAGVRTITLNYNAQNRVATASLPGSRTVTYTYDVNGNLISAQPDAPTGRIAKYSYDANHNLLQIQDESGNAAATQAVDVYGRVTGTTQPGVATPFTQSYNLATKTSQMTGPNGASQATEFNTKNDPTKVTDARGNFTTMTYNGYRDMTSVTTPDNKTRQLYMDGSGRRAATVQPNGRVDRAFYNSFGSPTLTFHGKVDSVFTNAFNADHVMTSASYGSFDVNKTQYGYDAKGNRTSVTDANSRTQQFSYDAAGNMSWSRDARGKQTDFTYDTNTRLTRVRNALGHQVDMTYDTRDNLTQVATAAGTVDFAYNLKNQVTSVTTGNVGARRTTSYTYDAKGQISTVTDPNSKVTQYAYDARGNLTGITHDGISRFTYTYDGMNRLTATNYTGTAGGARASLVPTAPVGNEMFRSGTPMTIKWFTQGDWTGNTNVTIQYSTDGVNWTNIATVAAANGTYTWATPVNSNTLRIRFVRTGDSTFRSSTTAPFQQVATVKYYVNDSSRTGDLYCSAAGQTYNGTTVTGRTAANPVNNPQAIFDNNVLLPGDIVYIDTGSYALNHDFLITQADSGTAALPVTIQGPTSGTGAIISRVASANPNNAVIVVVDTNTTDSTLMQGIAIQNIKTGAGRIGMWFIDAQNCAVRDCECSQATIPGATGAGGDGIGILLLRGGNHVIERNLCHDNGGNGGNGATGNAGGSGTSAGIFSLTSNSNTIRFNECYANRGIGGVGGSTTALAGKSLAFGIKVQGCNATQISDNICRDNDSVGVSSSTGLPGDAEAYGIFFNGNTNTFVERNVCYGNDATGGSSSAKNGGEATAIGLLDYNESGARVANNRCYNNRAFGGLSSTAAGFTNGGAESRGITVSSSPNALIINNLCYGNNSNASPRRVAENSGLAIGCGIRIEQDSPGATILHNTVERNNAVIGNLGSVAGASGLQIVVVSRSTGVTVKNNSSGAEDFYGACIYVDDDCKTGFVSDYNDFYLVNPSSSVGQWGSAGLNDLLGDWQAASGQDSHSLSLDPQYYNQPASNYHLKSTSPVIDKGVLLANAGVDVDGENRPQKGPIPALPLAPDMGYDEFKDSDADGLADAIETSVTLTNANDADTDHDGLPDGWEVANTLDPNSAAGINGAAGDPDSDTYGNLAEYLGGSNPKLGSSIPAQPPVITSATPSETNPLILEQDSIAFSATATDANGQAISYSWKLDGVVKSSTNSYNFTTTDVSSGPTSLSKSYIVELSVTAGGDIVTRTWTVTVGNRNRPPVLQSIGTINVRPGQTIQLNPVYSDPDNQNSATGDDNVLTVSYSGFMTGPTKTVSVADIGAQTVTVTVQDNGNPSLSAQQTSQVNVVNAGAFIDTPGGNALAVTEGGSAVAYGLSLLTPPTSPVTISVNSGSQVTVSPSVLTFTPANWSAPQTVLVTAVDNFVVDGARVATIAHTAASSDAIYNGVGVSSVTANISDNDVAGLVAVQSGGSTAITEGSAVDSYTLALTSIPSASVTVTINGGAQTTATPATLTFTSATWNVPQTVTVTATDDKIVEGTHNGTISHSATSTDALYNGVGIANVVAAITDNDSAGVTIAESGGSTTVIVGGATDTYTVVLNSQPTATVTVNASTATQLSVAPAQLSFTTANWNIPQTITVTAALAGGSSSGTITHVATSSDPNYSGITVSNVAVSITQTYSIATSSAPLSGGSTSGGGTVNSGALVTLIATPNSGYGFVNWTESGSIVSTSATYSFTASANRVLVANFATPPFISSPTSANVTGTTAVLGGNVTGNGGSPVTVLGVVYAPTATNANPQIGGAGAVNLSGTGKSGVFTVNATGLTPGVAYSFAAYATNAAGTTYTSPVAAFTTVMPPSGLVYARNPATYTKGAAIASNAPTSSGSPGTSYAVSPPLPAGLSLHLTTGVITGTPTVLAETATYTVTATNAGGSTTASLTLTVNDVAPSALTYTANTATYIKGSAVMANTPASSGGPVTSFSVSPALPAGLNLNSTTGVITGTPTIISATTGYTITASNSGGSTTASLTLTVNDVAPTALTYAGNPAVYTKGTEITANTPTNSGGAVISFSVTPALPAGLNLNTTTGSISGTPSALTSTTVFTVTATNTGGSTTASLTLTVNDVAPSVLTYSSNPAAYTKDSAITANTPTSNGGPVTSYSISPELPAGLNFSTVTGAISGTPSALASTVMYTITASNSGGSTTASLTLTVNDVAPSVLTYSSNPAVYTKGSAITANTPTSNGGPVTSYSISPELPAGLNFSTVTGAISGTPTVLAATAAHTITAANSGGTTTASLTLTVNDVPPSALTYSSNPAVYTQGTAITANTPTSSGGPVTSYSISPSLPTGLNFSTVTGAISGTPTALSASTIYTINANNTGGTATVLLTVTVNAPPTAPVISTPTTAGITSTNAVLGGLVVSDGGASLTAVGIVYAQSATNPNPQIGGTGVTNLTAANAPGAFTVNVSGLTPSTAYSFKAYAVNSLGTSYTAPATAFTTPVAPVCSLGASSLLEGPAAGTDSILLNVVPSTGSWTATANDSWLHLNASNASGTGGALVVFTFDANPGTTRTGTLTIGGQTLTVQQAGSTYVAANPLTTLVPGIISSPRSVAVDSLGNIYIADTGNNAIRKWTTATQTLSTIVSTGLNFPDGLAVDGAGNVYIGDSNNGKVKKWSAATQTVSILVSGVSASGLAVDPAGNVFIADWGSNAIKKWSAATQTVSTLVSSGISFPSGVALDSAGDIYIADRGNDALKKWSVSTQTLSTLVSAGLNSPHKIALDAAGNVYIASSGGNSVKKWAAATQTLSTPVSAGLSGPVGVAVDNAGNLIVADTGHSAIKLWTASTQTLSTLVSAELSNPTGVAADGTGNVYIADNKNNAIKKWSFGNQAVTAFVSSGLSMPTGVAIDGSGSLYSVDWGTSSGAVRKWNSATQTLNTLATGFNSPGGVAADNAGNLFISDTGRHAIKKWNSSSQITTTLVSSGLSFPSGIAVDWLGKVYIADTNNRQVKVWDPVTQAVTTLIPTVGISGPNGLAVDGSGNVYIADVGLNVINMWNAATQTLRTKVAAGLRRPYGVAVDALNNIYIADSTANAISEMPNAYVDSTSKSEPFSAGSDSLPAVLPTATNLLPPFAPTSDQPWLTIGSITNGVVSFSFTTNTGASRSAHINLLGQTITVTQAAAPLSSNALLSNLVVSGGGILAPTFTSGTTSYAMSVVNTVNTLTVTPTTAESHAIVSVSGVTTPSGNASAPVALLVGPNDINVLVTAQDGVTKLTYRVVVTRMTAIDTWWQQRFGSIEHTGDAADDADPRQIGIPNLIDYALHKDSGGNISGRDILPQPARGGDNKLHLSFTRYQDRNDVTVTVQGADSPAGPWTDLASSVGGTPFNVTQPGATVEETGTGNARAISVGDLYLVNDPAHPRRFMRLKVTRP